MQLYNQIKQTEKLLQELIASQKLALDHIESVTFDVIADDDFDKLPDDLQDILA